MRSVPRSVHPGHHSPAARSWRPQASPSAVRLPCSGPPRGGRRTPAPRAPPHRGTPPVPGARLAGSPPGPWIRDMSPMSFWVNRTTAKRPSWPAAAVPVSAATRKSAAARARPLDGGWPIVVTRARCSRAPARSIPCSSSLCSNTSQLRQYSSAMGLATITAGTRNASGFFALIRLSSPARTPARPAAASLPSTPSHPMMSIRLSPTGIPIAHRSEVPGPAPSAAATSARTTAQPSPG